MFAAIDRNAVVLVLRMLEDELAADVDLRARRQRRALRADQHVLEVQLDLALDVHRRSPAMNFTRP